jgi:RNA recognition motif-containing protein
MNLFVGNLSPETTDVDLRTAFSEFGEIVSVKVLKDMNTGESRGFGFVEMADKFHSFDAIDNLDCTYMLGNIISVKEAKQKTGDAKPNGFAPRSRNSFSQNSSRPAFKSNRASGDGNNGYRPNPRPAATDDNSFQPGNRLSDDDNANLGYSPGSRYSPSELFKKKQ